MARWLETTTGWSIKRLITTTRRYRTITITIAGHTHTATDPLPPDLTQILTTIHHDTKRAKSGRRVRDRLGTDTPGCLLPWDHRPPPGPAAGA